MKPSREIRYLALGFFHDFCDPQIPGNPDGWSSSEHATLIGTDPAEFFVGGPQIDAILSKQREEILPFRLRMEPRAVHAFEHGDVGWAACEVAASLEGGPSPTARATLIFGREEGRWRIVH